MFGIYVILSLAGACFIFSVVALTYGAWGILFKKVEPLPVPKLSEGTLAQELVRLSITDKVECTECQKEVNADDVNHCSECEKPFCEDCLEYDHACEYCAEEAGKDAASEAYEISCNDAADDFMDRF